MASKNSTYRPFGLANEIAVRGIYFATNAGELADETATSINLNAVKNPINMDAIHDFDTASTGSLGNVIKMDLTGTATHTATTAGAIVKNYMDGCTLNGNYEASAIIGYLKHKATLSGGAKSSLMSLHRHSSSSGTVDYGIRIFSADSKLTTMLYASGTMTNFAEFVADGSGGFTAGTGMVKDPESDSEAGFLTIVGAGTTYQIPCYAIV